jgi:hypothetical protein
LKYIFYIYIENDNQKEKILTNKLVYDGEQSNQVVSVPMPEGEIGVDYTDEEIKQMALKELSGEVITLPTKIVNQIPIYIKYQRKDHKIATGIHTHQYRVLMEAHFRGKSYYHIVNDMTMEEAKKGLHNQGYNFFKNDIKKMFKINTTHGLFIAQQIEEVDRAPYSYFQFSTFHKQSAHINYYTFTNARIRPKKQVIYNLTNSNIIFNDFK